MGHLVWMGDTGRDGLKRVAGRYRERWVIVDGRYRERWVIKGGREIQGKMGYKGWQGDTGRHWL